MDTKADTKTDIDTETDKLYNLITLNLHEIIGDSTEIKNIINERPLKVYWGTSSTGKPHIGYFVPLLKIIDMLNAGCEITILIADLHAVLDNLKSTFDQVEKRTVYYITLIKTILLSLNVNLNKLRFIRGSDFQLSKEYTLDMYRANTLITVNDAKHAGAEVVKQSDNPKMSGLLYPTLQALDEQYLGVDAELGGVDQRKIFVHARALMPLLGYRKRSYFLNKMVSGLRLEKKVEKTEKNIMEEKMSSSNMSTKIDFLDTKKQIATKINKCYCLPGDVEDNCLLEILEHIIFPVLKLKKLNFVINRKEKFGGPIEYSDFDQVKKDFLEKKDTDSTDIENYKLHPGDLKFGIADNLEKIIQPIRDILINDKQMSKLIKEAYPDQ